MGCGKKDDPIAQAEKKDVAKGVAAPSIVEVKAIAEEGFIYGLPLAMNYAVMNEFAVDTKSSQLKAPFNEINNQHRVATYEDTAVVTPNSDTPYSVLWLDLRAEPMVISLHAYSIAPNSFALSMITLMVIFLLHTLLLPVFMLWIIWEVAKRTFEGRARAP